MRACPSCSFENSDSTYFCGRCRLYLQPVGEYLLVREVGKGGFASVYEAVHPETQQKAAVKILHNDLSRRKDILVRFEREAQVMMELDSDYIVKLYDFGVLEEHGLGIYLTMEWCEGQTFFDAIEHQPQKRFSPAKARALCTQLLLGLEHIHERGIVHRDLKPSNLMLVDSKLGKQLKILDFGVAWTKDASLTGTGMIIGSLMFMAPEQIRAKKQDYGPQTDLYAVGLILAWMLTGEHPFGDFVGEAMALRHISEKPATLSELCPNVSWSDSLEDVIARALCKKTHERFESARAFLNALQRAEFPDFAKDVTLPIEKAVTTHSTHSISPYEETGTQTVPSGDEVHPSLQQTAHERAIEGSSGWSLGPVLSESSVQRHFDEMEEEYPSQKGLLWGIVILSLIGLIALGAYKLHMRPLPTHSVTAHDAGEKVRSPEQQIDFTTPQGQSGVPRSLQLLMTQWRDAWQNLSKPKLSATSLHQLYNLYHPNFRSVTHHTGREEHIRAMRESAAHTSWMRLQLTHFSLQGQTADEIYIQFQQKSIISTLQASKKGQDDVQGSIRIKQGTRILRWRRTHGVWKIWRSFWYPKSHN